MRNDIYHYVCRVVFQWYSRVNFERDDLRHGSIYLVERGSLRVVSSTSAVYGVTVPVLVNLLWVTRDGFEHAVFRCRTYILTLRFRGVGGLFQIVVLGVSMLIGSELRTKVKISGDFRWVEVANGGGGGVVPVVFRYLWGHVGYFLSGIVKAIAFNGNMHFVSGRCATGNELGRLLHFRNDLASVSHR